VERAGDQIIQHEGAAVLLVQDEIAEQLNETTIHYGENETGSGLVMKRT
jgi:Fe-S cluster assembly iron-binding protein IscA